MEAFVDGSGLFAVSGHRGAAHLVYLGLHALQHRGPRGVAVAASDGDHLRTWSGDGWVGDALDASGLQQVPGTAACGVVWQPPGSGVAYGRYQFGQVAAAVSGRFTNGERLRNELQASGALFHTSSDAELLLHLVAQSGRRTFINRLVDALWRVSGAYALVVMSEDRVVAVRDPSGFRPLSVGQVGEARVIATEDAAIRFAGGTPLREVGPGEMVILEGGEELAVQPFAKASRYACVHEWVSLARADAAIFGRPVFPLRYALGERLAQSHPCGGAELVVAVPGAEAHAAGFASSSGIPQAPGLLRPKFAPAHLEEPPFGMPDFGTRAQLQAVGPVVEGRVVCMVAASLGNPTPLAKACRMLTEVGAVEVHLRIASPRIQRGCRYGVASPADDQLPVGSALELGADIGVHTLGFLPLAAMREVLGASSLCDACFSGDFPIVPDEVDDQLPLFEGN